MLHLFVQKYLKLCLLLLLVMLSLAGATKWFDVLLRSAQNYGSFLTDAPLQPVNLATAQSQRLIVIVIGGLSDDNLALINLPNLQRLQESGATATIVGHSWCLASLHDGRWQVAISSLGRSRCTA